MSEVENTENVTPPEHPFAPLMSFFKTSGIGLLTLGGIAGVFALVLGIMAGIGFLWAHFYLWISWGFVGLLLLLFSWCVGAWAKSNLLLSSDQKLKKLEARQRRYSSTNNWGY